MAGTVWGHKQVRPIYKGAKLSANPRTAFQLFWETHLVDALEIELFKLVGFHRHIPEWRPDRLLLVCPLGDVLEGEWTIPFWGGEAAELAAEEERRQKASEKAARAKAKAASGAGDPSAPKKRRPRAAPSAQQEAVKAARASAVNGLLALPAPPSGPQSDEEAAAAAHSDTSEGSLFGSKPDDNNGPETSSDSEVDILLATYVG